MTGARCCRRVVEYLPSDRVSHVVGLEGHVPKELAGALQTRDAMVRLTFFVNTWYPEVVGGYYLNHRLVRRLGSAVNESGLHIVDPEYVDQDHDVPAEKLEWCDALGSVYLLLDDDLHPSGSIMRWEYSAGSGVELFDTSHIVDIVAEDCHVEEILSKARVSLSTVAVELRAAELSENDQSPRRSWWYWITKW